MYMDMSSRPGRISRLVPAVTLMDPLGTVPALVCRMFPMIFVRRRLDLPGVAHP